ncbi:phage tail sheath protein [Sedimenticola hydrogenitrophicus]|uniref:phage tail sheath protein n=1 Tax=Sedimenticola hydrogenitrophicus TaxID=2967975 RepID=UPI0023B0CC1B|nr:phage tail sheath protein [Sedimenticola hydrogenitrophicus]
MPADYHHGVRVAEVTEGTRPIRMINTAVIGLVGTAPDADAAKFPLNTPVLIAGNRAEAGALDLVGDGNGSLPGAMDAIFDQIAPNVIVIRVDEGIDAAETTSNVIGTVQADGSHTGLQALLTCKAKLGLKPRILGAPGLDVQAVATEFEGIADKLRAFAYVSCAGAATKEDAVAYRANFGSKRLMLVWPEFTGWDVATSQEVELAAVARALGLRAKIDNDIGWHKNLSNVAVAGVTGINKDLYFDLQAEATDTNYLNSNEVTTLIREDGFRFWGSRTCSADPKFAFETATRTGDILADTIAEAHMWAVDKPMSKTLIRDIVEGVNAKFRELKALGYIVDAHAWVDPDKNTVEVLESGKLYIDYDYTPIPPLENLQFFSRITNDYLVQLIQQ